MKTWDPTPEQLLCRDLQHSWKPDTAFRVKTGYVRTLVCVRCTTRKAQTLDKDGYIIESRMSYPDGYLRPEGRLTRDDRADLRVRNLG